jgi:hypothetical protein
MAERKVRQPITPQPTTNRARFFCQESTAPNSRFVPQGGLMFSITKIIRFVLAVLVIGFATLPSNTALAEDGGKINTGG